LLGSPLPPPSPEAIFTFAWTAPTFNDTVTLYGAGNSSDGQQSLSGDGIIEGWGGPGKGEDRLTAAKCFGRAVGEFVQ